MQKEKQTPIQPVLPKTNKNIPNEPTLKQKNTNQQLNVENKDK